MSQATIFFASTDSYLFSAFFHATNKFIKEFIFSHSNFIFLSITSIFFSTSLLFPIQTYKPFSSFIKFPFSSTKNATSHFISHSSSSIHK